MTKKGKGISRRRFLETTSCAAVGCTTLLSTLLSLKAVKAAAADNSSLFIPGAGSGDYKALVCIMLSGGNDSYNMLIPKGDPEYAEYALTRTNLAIPQNDILLINPLTTDGRQFGVHPSMPEVQSMFDQNKLAFISNVGTMVEPTTKDQYLSGVHPLPNGLYSHTDQRLIWQTGNPQDQSTAGWGGQIADLIQSMNDNQNISMNISLSGHNIFQQGQNVLPFVINENGAIGITRYNDTSNLDLARRQGIDNILDQAYSDVYQQTYINTIKSSNEAGQEFQQAIEGVDDFMTQFPNTGLAENLEMVARSIAARETLGFDRQIYFVSYGTWDHHDNILSRQSTMLGELSEAMAAFQSTLEELNVDDCVTTFTVSDFARKLTSNGDGTDHAWGGNMMVMGGAINGGDMYGTYPSLELGNEFEVGNGGRLIPTTSADEYLSELALWFGVSPSDCNMIFPNLSNFYDTASPDLPIGFLNI